jgi:hypothetical protein
MQIFGKHGFHAFLAFFEHLDSLFSFLESLILLVAVLHRKWMGGLETAFF